MLRSSAILDSGVVTVFLPENPNELFDRLKLLVQEKQAGNNSDIFNIEIIAIADKLLEYKCTSNKQHRVLLLKYLNQMKTVKQTVKSWNVIIYDIHPVRHVQIKLLKVKYLST